MPGSERGHPRGDAEVARPRVRGGRRARGLARARRGQSSRSTTARSRGSSPAGARFSVPRGTTRTSSRRRRAHPSSTSNRSGSTASSPSAARTRSVSRRASSKSMRGPRRRHPEDNDNDLSATEDTFGFDTALDVATEALDRLHTTAESHSRVMVVEVMGRDTGGSRSARHRRRCRRHPDPRATVTVEEAAGEIESRNGRGKFSSSSLSASGTTNERQASAAFSGAPTTSSATCASAGSATCRPGDRGADGRGDAGHRPRPRPARRHAGAPGPDARHPLRPQGGRPSTRGDNGARWPRCGGMRSSRCRSETRSPS